LADTSKTQKDCTGIRDIYEIKQQRVTVLRDYDSGLLGNPVFDFVKTSFQNNRASFPADFQIFRLNDSYFLSVKLSTTNMVLIYDSESSNSARVVTHDCHERCSDIRLNMAASIQFLADTSQHLEIVCEKDISY
jgi:hypothetical protein